jgi:LCP family protein required for cell wall assembly
MNGGWCPVRTLEPMAESSRDSSRRAVQRPSAAAQWAPVRRASEPDSERSRGRAQVPRSTGGVYGRPRRTPPAPPTRNRPGGPGGPDEPGGPEDRQYRGRRRNWRRGALIGCAVALVLAMLAVGGLYMYARSLDKRVARTDPFSAITGGRPAGTVDGVLNILMVGSDSRDPDIPVDEEKDARADTMIIMHIPANHDEAYLVSIPRDLWVPVPASAGAPCGGDRAKINAAFALGGLPLAVRTVECFTDVRIDHVMAIDFGGFKEVTDALGGVDLNIERTVKSIHKPYRTFVKGRQHLNGTQALDYVRQRKQFPDGDFARMRHQQQFLRALMDKAASTGTLTNPGKLNGFLKSVTKAVTVDEDFSLVDMALQFRNLRGDNLKFLTSPNQGSETIDGQSVVVSDREKASSLYQAMVNDEMAAWVKANPSP